MRFLSSKCNSPMKIQNAENIGNKTPRNIFKR